MVFPKLFDPADAQDILRYSKWLIGKTFYDILEADAACKDDSALVSGYEISKESKSSRLSDSAAEYGSIHRKGGLGNLVEEHFFHYRANSSQEPDFPLAKLELKVSPYEERRGRGNRLGEIYCVAGERLVLTMIDFNQRPIQRNLLESHLWHKCGKILLVYYLRDRTLGNNLQYPIKYVGIFTPNPADLIIIREDYEKIMDKIASGRAHEISESDTMYLGACTKGSTAERSVVVQNENGIKAQKRAFCFKSSYMTTVLNEYLINAPEEHESVVTDTDLLEKLGFERYIQSKINKFVGKTDKEICKIFGIEYSGNKAQWIKLAFAMLGIKSNKADEFQKANIAVKATRIEEEGYIRENTSLPPFKFKELVAEEWMEFDEESEGVNREDVIPSTLQSYFASTKFLFVVFKKHNNEYVLRGCQLWNMPFNDLNVIVRECWERARDVVSNGVCFEIMETSTGKIRVYNNLPGESENKITHVRPHSSKAYYKIEDYESGNPKDGNELPDGRWMTTQCFWLNRGYVLSILRDDLK